MVQVMVMAVAELTHRLLPGMIARRYGRIINVASVAGLVPQSAGHTLYGASKSLVIKFSQSIALEGMPHNVYTTALCPGFTYSEFHDVNGMRAQVSRLPSWMWMDAGTVARQGFDAVMAGRIICVNGRVNRAMVFLARHMPQWLVMAVVKRVSRRVPPGVTCRRRGPHHLCRAPDRPAGPAPVGAARARPRAGRHPDPHSRERHARQVHGHAAHRRRPARGGHPDGRQDHRHGAAAHPARRQRAARAPPRAGEHPRTAVAAARGAPAAGRRRSSSSAWPWTRNCRPCAKTR